MDFHATAPLDDEAADALVNLRAALDEVRTDLVLQPGDMVFLDNRLVVHGRVAFTPATTATTAGSTGSSSTSTAAEPAPTAPTTARSWSDLPG
ncbi:hypothetical protein GCM10029964_068460 [Kibdelosporangium lantanae]